MTEVNSHRDHIIELDKTGTHLKYFSQKQDVVLIKNLLLSVQGRWEKLVQRSVERGRQLDDARKRAKQVRLCFIFVVSVKQVAAAHLELENKTHKVLSLHFYAPFLFLIIRACMGFHSALNCDSPRLFLVTPQFHESWNKLMEWLDESERNLDSEVEIANEPDKIKTQLLQHKVIKTLFPEHHVPLLKWFPFVLYALIACKMQNLILV